MLIRNNAMRLFIATASMMLITIIFLGSCKKDHDKAPTPQPSNTVVGIYSGKQSLGPNDQANFKFELKSNGVFEQISTSTGNVLGKGTWYSLENTVNAVYTMLAAPHSKYSITGVYNPANSKLNGTWGFDDDPSDGGTIQMTK